MELQPRQGYQESAELATYSSVLGAVSPLPFSQRMGGDRTSIANLCVLGCVPTQEGGELLNTTRPAERTSNQVSAQQLGQEAIGPNADCSQ